MLSLEVYCTASLPFLYIPQILRILTDLTDLRLKL